MTSDKPRKYILDTGYLIAYYRVDGAEEEFVEVKRRFDYARDRGDSGDELIAPWPVLFELAAHIPKSSADINLVRTRAIQVATDIKLAVAGTADRIFSVSPLPDPKQVSELLSVYAGIADGDETGLAGLGFSLVDTAVHLAAQDWQKRVGRTHDVIIWTWERRRSNLRSYSPVEEADPYPPWVD